MPNLPDKKPRPWIPKKERKRDSSPFKSTGSRSSYEMKQFYNSASWRSLRHYKIQLNPLCEECERKGLVEPGAEIDHIESIRDGGLKLTLSNLQTLCKSCHASKSSREGHAAKHTKKYY